jgi:hypothetical protein
VLVCTRPAASVAGTRCTRCTPASHLSLLYTPLPVTWRRRAAVGGGGVAPQGVCWSPRGGRMRCVCRARHAAPAACLQPANHSPNSHLQHDLLVAARVGLDRRHQRRLPALRGGVALVHAQQVARPDARLVAARTRAARAWVECAQLCASGAADAPAAPGCPQLHTASHRHRPGTSTPPADPPPPTHTHTPPPPPPHTHTHATQPRAAAHRISSITSRASSGSLGSSSSLSCASHSDSWPSSSAISSRANSAGAARRRRRRGVGVDRAVGVHGGPQGWRGPAGGPRPEPLHSRALRLQPAHAPAMSGSLAASPLRYARAPSSASLSSLWRWNAATVDSSSLAARATCGAAPQSDWCVVVGACRPVASGGVAGGARQWCWRGTHGCHRVPGTHHSLTRARARAHTHTHTHTHTHRRARARTRTAYAHLLELVCVCGDLWVGHAQLQLLER